MRMGSDGGGFTLVEVVVSLLVLVAGVLVMAGSAARSSAALGEGRRSRLVGGLARERIETVRASPCAGPDSGSQVGGPLEVGWSVTAPEPRLRLVRVVVRSQGPRGARADTFEAVLPC